MQQYSPNDQPTLPPWLWTLLVVIVVLISWYYFAEYKPPRLNQEVEQPIQGLPP